MYPKRDFRYLIQQCDIPENVLISALRREPLSEVLWYWSQSGKPVQQLSIYQRGIEEAIARHRYPLYQLENIKSYPEFLLPTINGLKRLWISLRFSLDFESLLIDSINGQNINISPENKLRILEIIPHRICLTLSIDNQPSTLGVFPSRRAEQIYQLIHSISCIY